MVGSWFPFFVLCVCACSVSPTLCDPMGYSPPGSSVLENLQARILEWVAIPFSRGSSQSRDGTWVSCIAGRFFTVWATREAHSFYNGKQPEISELEYEGNSKTHLFWCSDWHLFWFVGAILFWLLNILNYIPAFKIQNLLLDWSWRVRESETFGLIPRSWVNEGAIYWDGVLWRRIMGSFVFGGNRLKSSV